MGELLYILARGAIKVAEHAGPLGIAAFVLVCVVLILGKVMVVSMDHVPSLAKGMLGISVVIAFIGFLFYFKTSS